jgi:nuclear transport factor 2 (NTF2) superfamily protein
MKKDISRAFAPIYEKDENWENTEKILFEWIKIQKIFDKNWSEEKQQKAANEINELFGDEVVITEE